MNSRSSPILRPAMLRRMFAGLPALASLLAMTAVGLWGHATGWQAPGFAQLFGHGGAASEDWCLLHNVPESRCIACHPELAGESAADWCKEHGVPESRCTICHPEILTTGVAADWCREHGLPETCCTLCHPEIARPGELPADPDAPTVQPAEPQDPAAPARDPKTCQKHALKVQFASAASMAKAGIGLGQVITRPMADTVVASAEVDYDRTRFARIAARVPGVAFCVQKNEGARVERGEVLALVDSAEVGRSKAEYLQAAAAVHVTAAVLERIRKSSEAGFRTAAERAEAEARAREAEIRLLTARQALANLRIVVPEDGIAPEAIATLGLPESLVATLPAQALPANLVPVSAPFDGVVVARRVVAGDPVEPMAPLFEIADLRRMWVMMDIREADVRRIALGQPVVFRADDAPDEAVPGSVAWISTAVDEVTRTVKVRAEVENPAGTLRAHAFGQARIVVRGTADTVAVPSEALQWEGCCDVVFVRLADEIFQTRKVRLGTRDAAYTEILAGLVPGEVVVTTGSHVLKSEILKSNLGAGCCDDR